MRKQPKGKIQVQEEIEDFDEVSDVEEDSDEELATAFEEGLLQPGLNTIVPFTKKIIVNNLTGLNVKLNEIKQNLDWIERLDLENEPAEITEEMQEQFGDIEFKRNKKGNAIKDADEDPQNDFKREMLFFRQAQAATNEAIPKLKELGVKTKRPSDYFAQTLKTDSQMSKIQNNLKSKQEALEKSGKAKKMREMKKMGKKIQHEVLLNRQKEKRDMLDKVKAYKKGKINTLDLDQKPKKGILKKNDGKARLNKKQAKKSETYGFGGQKKRGKSNNAESFAEDFSLKRGRLGGRNVQKGKEAQRPGKSKRQQKKGR